MPNNSESMIIPIALMLSVVFETVAMAIEPGVIGKSLESGREREIE